MKHVFYLLLVILLCAHSSYSQKETCPQGDTMTFEGFVLMPGYAGVVGGYTSEGDISTALPVGLVGGNYFIQYRNKPLRFSKALKAGVFFTSFTRFGAFLPPDMADSIQRNLAACETVTSPLLLSIRHGFGAQNLHYNKFWRARGITGELHLVKIKFRYVAYKELLITLPNPAFRPNSNKRKPWLSTQIPTFFITEILQAEIVEKQF
ncbi:hypothetical protein [Hymenobacter koreensis]|uniref:hypothetical protein n=1 Tax=Hymenobacter koreensis TaxID=1084523 RepID=UPI0031ED51E4